MLIIVRVYLRAGRRIEIEQLPGQAHFHKAIAVAKIGERIIGRVRGIERALPQAARFIHGQEGSAFGLRRFFLRQHARAFGDHANGHKQG